MQYADYPPSVDQPLCLSRAEWQDPLLVINSLFETYDYVWLKKSLRRWLRKAVSEHCLRRRDLAETADCKDQLIRLLEMATLMPEGELGGLEDDTDGMNQHWWRGPQHPDHPPFDYFPGSLSAKQYRNPQRVLDSCLAAYNLPLWRKILEDTWLAGYTTDTLQGLQNEQVAFEVLRLLPRLLDAARLIYVRELCKMPAHDKHIPSIAD